MKACLPILLCTLGLLSACGGADAEERAAPGAVSTQEAALADAASPGPREGDVSLSTGVRLHYVEQGSRTGPVLVLLHGYTDSFHSFDRDYALLPTRYHVYALDQRGHGDSSRPACCSSQSAFAADVVAFLDARGHARAVLVGHSMGSFIAQQVALDHPQRVRALVLVGSAPTANTEVVRGLRDTVATLHDPIDPAFVRDFQASTFYRPIPPAFLDTAVSESLKVPARVWKAALDGLVAENHTARLPRITQPVLVVGGERDSLFSVAEQRALVRALPDARFALYPETGHAPHVERPQRFVDDLLAFLQGPCAL